MTQEFGATAWGHAWLRRIEPITITGAPDSGLPRARALARRGVTDLVVESGRITARITDRAREHGITLDVPAWSPREQSTVARMVGDLGTSRSGDLPDELVPELASAGVRLAPRIDDITATSDVGRVSRRHVLATCYALVQRIDEQPVLAIHLRTPQEMSARRQDPKHTGLLALTDIDPTTFYASRPM